MFYRIIVVLAIACVAVAPVGSKADLTVATRTGTFVGDYNDTYSDVKQFKWIPYAKVR